MNEEQAKALRAPIPEQEIGHLPRVTCPDCRNSPSKVCEKHAKSKCQVCDNYMTGAHLHLDYFGHAETTDRLLSVDPEWSWEPVGWGDDGMPLTSRQGNNLVMWGRLTVAGITRPGVGTCDAKKDDAHKELIGDFLRNASMRFGVALDLWRKSERHVEEEHAEPAGASVVQDSGEAMAGPDEHNLIRDCLGYLTSEQLAEFQAWWKAALLPSIKNGDTLTVDQAEMVNACLDGFDAGSEGDVSPGVDAGAADAPAPSDPASLLADAFPDALLVESPEDVPRKIAVAEARKALRGAKS